MAFSLNGLVNELEDSFKGAGKSIEDAMAKVANTKLDANTRNEMFKTICGIIPGKISNDTVLSAFEVMRKQQLILKKDFSAHKAGNNSTFKSQHETTVKNNKGFVEDQNNYADMAYGESTMKYSGCEIFATYNALNALKRTNNLTLADMIADYEKDGMVMGGKFGTSPQAIYDFFKKKGFATTISTKEAEFDKIGQEYTTCILTMYNNKEDISKEVHTVNISKDGKNFLAHNVYCNGTVVGPADSVTKLIGLMNGGMAKGITLIGIK